MSARTLPAKDVTLMKTILLENATLGAEEQAQAVNRDAMQLVQALLKVLQDTPLDAKHEAVCPACEERFMVTVRSMTEMTRAVTGLMKAIDLNTRLTAFMQGKPDGRVEVVAGGMSGAAEWLKMLTPEQFGQVQRWIEEASVPVQIAQVVADGGVR